MYLRGFGNHHSSEARGYEGRALPQDQNSPQSCPLGLYAEQLSGSAFTAPRSSNLRSWLYRVLPSVCHAPFEPATNDQSPFFARVFGDSECMPTPNQLRWSPLPLPRADAPKIAFHQGIHTYCGSGRPLDGDGIAIHMYAANCSMDNIAMYNADGDFLIVPQTGTIKVQTEFGHLVVASGEICIIPRGIVFRVSLPEGAARGYILEVYDGHFELPELGPIGANGLANPRDFEYPVAAFDAPSQCQYRILAKYLNRFWVAEKSHSPFNVVAWHGNYAPFKYNLSRFCAMNSVTFDHPDPSIFTVLTCKSPITGTALADFVIFPPRWAVAENTFRPPYFHRNCMSEFMGLIKGDYEAKSGGGFEPGGASLHSKMTPHGPDSAAFRAASTCKLGPVRVADNTMAFMFETCKTLSTTKWSMTAGHLQTNYHSCWSDLTAQFTGLTL